MTKLLHRLILLLVFLLIAADARKERNLPHPHQGLLKPHEEGEFHLELENKDEKQLSDGKALMKQMPSTTGESTGGGAVCVQDIDAPPEAVWNQILSMDEYKGKVPKVLECNNYEIFKNEDGTFTLKTKQRIGILPGYSYENYYHHIYHPDKNSVVWTLDYGKTSDFDDVAGHWHVEEHPTKPGCTRVFYACDIKLKNAPPGPVMAFLSKSALRTATSWVKKESEAAPGKTIPDFFRPEEPVANANQKTQTQGRFAGFGTSR